MFKRGSAGWAGIIGTLAKIPYAVPRRRTERTLKRTPLLTDISQIAFKSMAIIPKLRRHLNGFPSAVVRALNIADFQRFCDRIAKRAVARGPTEDMLTELLGDERQGAHCRR